MSDHYPFLVPLNLSVWRTREAAIRGTVDLAGARDLESCVIDERTGEIVYEWTPRKRPPEKGKGTRGKGPQRVTTEELEGEVRSLFPKVQTVRLKGAPNG